MLELGGWPRAAWHSETARGGLGEEEAVLQAAEGKRGEEWRRVNDTKSEFRKQHGGQGVAVTSPKQQQRPEVTPGYL